MIDTKILLVHRHWMEEYREFLLETHLEDNIQENCSFLIERGFNVFTSKEFCSDTQLLEVSVWIKSEEEGKLYKVIVMEIKKELEATETSHLIERNKKNIFLNAFDLEKTWSHYTTRQKPMKLFKI